jgi:arsenate reductase
VSSMQQSSQRVGSPAGAGPGAEERILRRMAEQLTARFAGVFGPQTVERYVFESYQLLADASRIRHYLVPRTERFAASRLSALARADGLTTHGVPEVLFICVQNSGRSQLATALLRAHAGSRIHVRSAGSAPAESIEPQVVQIMAQRGLSLAEEFPKPLTDEVTRAADVLVTLGCGDSCPIYPGKRYLDWEIPDPAGLSAGQVEAIADQIDVLVLDLMQELIGARR